MTVFKGDSEDFHTKLVSLTGFHHLRAMTREQLIDELLIGQRRVLENMDTDNLVLNVIQARLGAYKDQLFAEAGVETGPMGFLMRRNDDDEGDSGVVSPT